MPEFLEETAVETWEEFRDLDEDVMLVGPYGDDEDLDIDFVFATALEDRLGDLAYEMGCSVDDLGDKAIEISETPAMVHLDDVSLHAVEDVGVIALTDGSDIVGLYTGHSLAVRDDCQKRGIGKALVVCGMVLSGENGVWNLDTPSYSPYGEACFRSATYALNRIAQYALTGEGTLPRGFEDWAEPLDAFREKRNTSEMEMI